MTLRLDDLGRRRIALVTDSSSQITADLVERFDVLVVPLTVTLDGVDHLEGIDLDADEFYERFTNRASPEVATSQPSPGRFVEAYRRAADQGYEAVVSIHLGEAMSGTVGSARLAAESSPIPVTVIDTGSASFGVAVCVWAAGVAIDRGATVDDLERRVAKITAGLATAFVVGVPLLAERGGRAADVNLTDDDGLPILAMANGQIDVLGHVSTTTDAVDLLATYAAGHGDHVTVALGTADHASRVLVADLERALTDTPTVDHIVHYRIGPSVGAHTGPGTFGLFVFPTIR